MGLKINWTNFAKSELQKIFDYYNENVSPAIAKNLVVGIVKESKKLENSPEIGQIEDLLMELGDYRYLVFKNYKIVYYINKNSSSIEILDVFDSRQNPIKIERRK
ncbi:MAG: type II toxin-antitoxin system RelE/ParE family toxin [Pedobacter sp.]|nr:MAG: type II toxin-antitoxin system RelE/ParE family toxin [Pedobacter sp.]